MADDLAQRKADHLAVVAEGRAAFRQSTLLEHVHLVHNALPECNVDDISLATSYLGKRLAVPLFITGMTGGIDDAGRINRELAGIAEAFGIGFGVGSQRIMAEDPARAQTFLVRDVAPTTLIVGNIGMVQARTYGVAKVLTLVEAIDADALAVHLNPAQELIQVAGDRDFCGGLDIIRALAAEVPVLVKETGCGIAPDVAARLFAVGVRHVDTAGAGGTSWVAVEAQRAAAGTSASRLGAELWDWGLPTAVAVRACAQAGLDVVASGGIRTGLDVARALALGARVAGVAAPVLQAYQRAGIQGVREFLEDVSASLRAVCALTGARSVHDLARVPRHLGEPLASYLTSLGISAR